MKLAHIALLACAAVAAACGATDSGMSTIPAGGFDLSDPDVQERLGAGPVENITWQRTAGEYTVVGRGPTPPPSEIDLIAAVMSDIPQALTEQAPIRQIVRVPNPPPDGRPQHEQAVAFALGPDIYLLDRAFTLSDGGSTRYDLTRAIVHELAHVAQWLTMSDDYIAAALAGEISRLDPTTGSRLVHDFAADTGWRTTNDDPVAPLWVLEDGAEPASTYGGTSAGEDMAESVSLTALGLADRVPQDRVGWVEDWLGRPADELAVGRPWAPAGAVEVRSSDALYDETAARAAQGPFLHAEPLYFELPATVPEAAELADLVSANLRDRQMSGSLERLGDDRLPRFGGLFTRSDGLRYWVEVWDFRSRADGTTGPDLPVLTYVAMW